MKAIIHFTNFDEEDLTEQERQHLIDEYGFTPEMLEDAEKLITNSMMVMVDTDIEALKEAGIDGPNGTSKGYIYGEPEFFIQDDNCENIPVYELDSHRIGNWDKFMADMLDQGVVLPSPETGGTLGEFSSEMVSVQNENGEYIDVIIGGTLADDTIPDTFHGIETEIMLETFDIATDGTEIIPSNVCEVPDNALGNNVDTNQPATTFAIPKF